MAKTSPRHAFSAQLRAILGTFDVGRHVDSRFLPKFGSTHLTRWITGTSLPSRTQLAQMIKVMVELGVPLEKTGALQKSYGEAATFLSHRRMGVEKDHAITGETIQALYKILKRTAEAEPPPIPTPGPASILRPTPSGFEIDLRSGPETELHDNVQQSTYALIIQRAAKLSDTMSRIENSNKDLVSEFREYVALLRNEIAEVDIAGLWAAGAALAQFVEALEPSRLAGTMTSPIEPGTLAALRSLLVNHVVFVEGTAIGREMRERVSRYRMADQKPEELAARAKPVLAAVLGVKGLLAEGARHVVGSLRRAIEYVENATLSVAVASYETARNAVLSIALALYRAGLRIEQIGLAVGLLGMDTTLLEPAKHLFSEHAPSIMALVANEPQMVLFLEWTMATTERSQRERAGPPTPE